MKTISTLLTSVALLAATFPVMAQQKPPIHGATDAMSVVGGAGTQPALPAGHPVMPTGDGGGGAACRPSGDARGRRC